MNNENKVMKSCFKKKNIFSFVKRKDKGKEKFLLHNCIQTLLSDPIVVLYTDENYICTGSLTGKVCLYKIMKKESREVNTDISLINNKKKIKSDENFLNSSNINESKENNNSNVGSILTNMKERNNNEVVEKYYIICMFRNNSIKSIYIDKRYLYIYYENCIDIFCIKTYQFIKRVNLEVSNNKQVIYYENLILFNNSKNLFIYDVTNNFMSYFYKNFLKNIVIFDFNINYLLCYKNNFGKCHIRVLQIFANAQRCDHELIFCVDFSTSSKFISHGKFLDDEKIIVAKNGKRLIIFDFKKAIDMYRIKKLKKYILDIHKSADNMLFILVENQIIIFNLSTFIFFKCIQLPTGLFYFKWSYFIRYKNNKIIFSSDKGVYYIDYFFQEND